MAKSDKFLRGLASKRNVSSVNGFDMKLKMVIISATKNTDRAKPAKARYFSSAISGYYFFEVINHSKLI